MKYLSGLIVFVILVRVAAAETIFIEAEQFTSSSNGWKVAQNNQTRAASRMQTLNGATGDKSGVASTKIVIRKPGNYRVWVRWLALSLPAKPGRWQPKHQQEKSTLLKMEFRTFVNRMMLLPCQIVKSGRKLIYRLLNYRPHLKIFFRLVHELKC